MKSSYYISVNGQYGCGAYQSPDFKTLPGLIAHMDRLGVCQTVAYHIDARDLHPVYGNKRLLKDINETPGAYGRILPALSATPSMTCGYGEMEHLIGCLADGKAGFIILFPKTCRFRLCEIKRVLECVRIYRPVILLDITEMDVKTDLPDLIDIAQRFPELCFVVKQVMWWQYSIVFDAMTRAGNIYLDTSWLHTRDGIKIIRDHIGKNRLVFGLGPKAHAGAAVASLAYADIPQAERDDIAYDNLISLIASQAVRDCALAGKKLMDDHIQNRFWHDFINGLGVRDTLVIDAHTHIGPFARSWYLTENSIERQIEILEADMRRFGIAKIISTPETALFGEPMEGNRIVERALTGKEHSFRGYLVCNPHYSQEYTGEVLDAFFTRNYFTGFKIVPEYLGVDIGSELFRHVFAYADAHSLPILIHTWEGKHGTAQQVAEVARRYRNATFIFGHTGGGDEGRRACEDIANDPELAHCLFEFCGSFTSGIEWAQTLKKIDYRRVIFGTDTIVHDIAWELGRLLSMDLPDEHIAAILGANMQRVLDRIIF